MQKRQAICGRLAGLNEPPSRSNRSGLESLFFPSFPKTFILLFWFSQFSFSGQWSNKYCFLSLAQLWFHNPLCTLQLTVPCKFMAETSALRQNALQWKKENSHLLAIVKASLLTERRWAHSSPQFPQAVSLRITFISPGRPHILV